MKFHLPKWQGWQNGNTKIGRSDLFLIDVIDKTELTEWTEFRLVNCQRLDSVDSVNSVQIHEERVKQSKGSAIGR